MKIVSYNVNGIRAALKKGLLDWFKEVNPDLLLIQETKAQPEQIDSALFEALGYHCYWHSAEKKGYSGVGIISKQKPKAVTVGCGIDYIDQEGRILRVDFEDLSVMSVYVPSGSSGDQRQDLKMQFLSDFQSYITTLKKSYPKLIIGGDVNICHQAIDIHNPKGNKDTSGFLPEEREWVSGFLDTGLIDSFRHFYPDLPDQYSWWSYRANARNNNKGWRIDYLLATADLEGQLQGAGIMPEAKHSDHCPIWVELNA